MVARRKITDAQREVLVSWMESHPLLSRQIVGSQTKSLVLSQWDELTSMLNAVADGTTKSTKDWRHYWSDEKSRLKKRQAAQRLLDSGTADSSTLVNVWSPIEERILSLISKENFTFIEDARIEVEMGIDIPPKFYIPQRAPTSPPPLKARPSGRAGNLPERISSSSAQPSPSPPTVGDAAASRLSQASSVEASSSALPPKRNHARRADSDDPAPVKSRPQIADAAASRLSQASSVEASSSALPPKRKYARRADSDDPAPVKSRPQTAPAQWALDLEERRIQEVKEQRELEERRLALAEKQLALKTEHRAWQRQQAEEERTWRRELLAAVKSIADNLVTDGNEFSNE